MSAEPTQAANQTAPGQPAADPHSYRDVLHSLITMGTDLARLLHQQATAQAQAAPSAPGPQPVPSLTPEALITLTTAFDGIARTIRRSIALAGTLDRPRLPTRNPAHARTAARQRIIREVEDAIQRASHAAEHAWPEDGSDTTVSAADLQAELRERLDAPDLDDDLTTRPVAEIITEIRRDLGLAAPSGTAPWKRRTPADLAVLRARAAAASAPRQPGAASKEPRSDTKLPAPAFDPERLAAIHTGPIRPGASPAPGPAKSIAASPRHPAHIPWRPPPDG